MLLLDFIPALQSSNARMISEKGQPRQTSECYGIASVHQSTFYNYSIFDIFSPDGAGYILYWSCDHFWIHME